MLDALQRRRPAHATVVAYPAEQAARRLAARVLHSAGIDNVTVVCGDGAAGLPEHAPYNAINVAATAFGEIPRALEQQLALGGRLVLTSRTGAE